MSVKHASVQFALLLFILSQLACAPRQAEGQETPALVKQTLVAELQAARDTGQPMCYRLRKSSPRFTSTKEICETKDGAVARLVALNDQPLNAADEEREQARLNDLLSNPSRQRHRKQSQDADTERVLKILRALPSAFLYTSMGQSIELGMTVEKFRFQPNPRFDPPNLETLALTEMSGELWIEPAQKHVVRLDGHLIQDVNFGWGILGQLDKGGWIRIDQRNVGGGHWRITHLQLAMTGRVVLKSKSFSTDEATTDFTPIATSTTYTQAVQLLRSGTLAPAQASR